MNRLLLLILSACVAGTTFSQDKSAYAKHWFSKGTDTLPYRLLLPKNYDAAKKYPLVLLLHGSGERGNNNEAQLVHGGKLFLQDSVRENYPAIVVFPQCPGNSFWSNVKFVFDSTTKKRAFNFPAEGEPTTAMKMLIALLDELEGRYKLDKNRLYVGGLSMGGMGTFELVKRKPKYFAAAFPICGGANPQTAKQLKRPKWWVFHGAKDDVVPPESSVVMVDALKKAGADVKFTLYPNANHNSWDAAFAEKDLLAWLFSKRK
ncbi:MAG TPA: prolyl oligopeptidase family serine peptidase [Flavisolibacter sp.]|jgi:predicted peptidase|nr:prolyl oligopeptidase family serine peptidase [Flavisolibacter sp.]